jgi:hypothetical protein
MATKMDATIGTRRCIGSTTFGIEAHEAPVDDFPVQASAKDGLGRMCRPHWTEYTRALRTASLARKAAEVVEAEPNPEPVAAAETPRRRGAPRPQARWRPSPADPRDRHTSGPGRESGAFVHPVASMLDRWTIAPRGRPVAPTAGLQRDRDQWMGVGPIALSVGSTPCSTTR